MTRDLFSGNAQHAHAQRGDDLYETPSVATEALLRFEIFPKTIWEPACGRGAIVRPLRAAGYTVLSSDLVNYESPDQDWHGRDFLMETTAPGGAMAIVTNPPYKLAEQFVAHGLTLCPKVVMLLRLAFLESERRSHILDSGHLARVMLFKKRLPMMHRDGWEGPKITGSSMAFAWFVFDTRYRGPTKLDRISWEK